MGFRVRNKREGEWAVVVRRRTAMKNFQTAPHRQNVFRPASRVSDGHRGFTRHQWWRGPREPPNSSVAQPITLFVDGISKNASLAEMRQLFEYEGQVIDVYISGKLRKNKVCNFGFIRYADAMAANRAVEKFNGAWLQGSKLLVSLAKYQKGGIPVKDSNPNPAQMIPVTLKTKSQNFVAFKNRDHRRYDEVLMGKKIQNTEQREMVEARQKHGSGAKSDLKIHGNNTMKKRMELAAVMEVQKAEEMGNTVARLNVMNIPLVGISALTSTKVALFFDCESDLLGAMEKSSPLHSLCPEIRRWSDTEKYLGREVWIECRGIDPRCWSHENLVIESSLDAGPLLTHMDSNIMLNEVASSAVHRAKKPRGRPKRVACSLPEPLFVPSTPSNSDIEVQKTWDTAKALGITAKNEKAVLSHLRKSKRLLALEESNSLAE